MDEGYGQQLGTYGDQPDCTSLEEQLQCNEQNEEMDNQIEGLADEENDERLDDGKRSDEEADNGQMGNANDQIEKSTNDDDQGEESINDDDQGEESTNDDDQGEESNNDDDPGEDCNINEDDFPLYPGALISFKVTMILLLAFSIRHNLTNEAISDLLYIINLMCPKPNRCCKSLYRFKKYFLFMVIPASFCYYCPTCFSLIDTTVNIICSVCKRVFDSTDGLTYFLHFSISHQIRALFAKPSFYEDISYRFQKQKSQEGNYEDIYDGSLYKKFMSSGGILTDSKNLSMTWNVDGVPLFKSSKFSLWPMYFLINELPYKLRTLKENSIFAGLWFGETKPNMSIFLKPVITELIKLESHGIIVKSPAVPEPFTSKVILLAGSCDLPAKSLMLNSMQFNGMYGCAKCYQPGITVSTSARGHTHAYPFNIADPTGPKRTAAAHASDARKAYLENSVTNGIKGPTWLMKLKSYDIIGGTAIDYMHCTLLGVMKQLLSLWFGTEHKKESYYIGRQISVVDQRLKEIKPPSMIHRKPRAISEHFKFFKASELRSFLLYYSLPVLLGVLPPELWDHFALFSLAIHILVQPSVSEYHLDCCQKMLNRFCCCFKEIYGERYMSSNVHLLLHLSDTVRELGPLWVYSCFHFEGLNGILKNLIHGTQQVDKQLITSYSYIKQLPAVANEHTQLSPYLEAFKHIYYQYK